MVPFANTANAGGFSVREQSAEGQGASFAGIAAGGSDLSSMFFNPATITMHEGLQTESDAALIFPYSKANNGVTTPGGLGGPGSGNIGEIALVPSSYASYQYNENLFLGFTVNSPFGLVTEGNPAWAGSFHGIKSDLFMVQAGPVVGYKINDMVSVAAAVRAVFVDVELTQNAGAAGVGTLAGDDVSVNFALGILLNPVEGTRIGIGYNSETSLDVEGALLFSAVPALNQPVTASLTTPGTLTVGLRQTLSDNLTLLLGFEWTDWSQLQQLAPINAVTGAPATAATPFLWEDGYYYSIGAEYQYDDNTTLRAGFAYEDSPVPDTTRGVRVPDADRYWFSVGASRVINEKWRGSVGYTHIVIDDGNVSLAPGGGLPGLAATFEQHVDIVAFSATYRWH